MPKFSPLQVIQETAEKFNITEDKQLPVDRQIAFIEQQIEEMKAICNRSLVDIAGLVMNRDSSKDEMSVSAYDTGIKNHEGELRQYTNKLDALMLLKQELEAQA